MSNSVERIMQCASLVSIGFLAAMNLDFAPTVVAVFGGLCIGATVASLCRIVWRAGR